VDCCGVPAVGGRRTIRPRFHASAGRVSDGIRLRFICLLASLAPAQILPHRRAAFRTVAAPASFACDTWQSFEFASITTGNLNGSDHNAGLDGWAITDASNVLSVATSGEKATLSSPQGTADTGTNGLAYDFTTGNLGSVRQVFTTAVSNVSFGCWVKFPTFSGGDKSIQFARLTDVNVNARARIYTDYVSGQHKLYWYVATNNISVNTVANT
jgi:hypothetical protein